MKKGLINYLHKFDIYVGIKLREGILHPWVINTKNHESIIIQCTIKVSFSIFKAVLSQYCFYELVHYVYKSLLICFLLRRMVSGFVGRGKGCMEGVH